jgi:RNA polymerase sigma-70 factor (ECF subfamily)
MPGLADSVDAGVDVMNSLRQLSLRLREAFLLVEWLGLTSEEAGSVLRIKPATVRVRVHRAKEKLRAALEVVDA